MAQKNQGHDIKTVFWLLKLITQWPTESRFSTYSRNQKWHRKWAISFGRNQN